MNRLVRSQGARLLDAFSIACLAAIGVALAVFEIESRDIGFHIRAGELIWQTGRIPTEDSFSYVAEGRPWLDSQWLFQVATHLAYGLAGIHGLVALRVGAVLTLLGALMASTRRNAGLPIALVVSSIAIFASLERFLLRPDLVSAAFLALFVAGSERLADRPRVWCIALPLIQIVWTNTHGLHVLGPAYLGLRAVGVALDDVWARRAGAANRADEGRRCFRQRVVLAALCTLAVLANANGSRGILYPFQLFQELQGEVTWFPMVRELISPLQRPLHSAIAPLAWYWLLVALSAGSIALAWRKLRLGQLLPLLAFFYLSLEAARNAPLFAVTAAPVVAVGLQELADRLPGVRPTPAVLSRWTALAMSLFTTAILAAVVSGALYRELKWPRRFTLGERFDRPSAEVLERLRATPGRILNDPNLGGYLIWKLYPDKQVAFDGRWEVYGEIFPVQRRALFDPYAFQDFVDEYGVTAVVVQRKAGGVSRRTPKMLESFPRFQRTLATPHILLYEDVLEATGPDVTAPALESAEKGG